MVCFIYSKLKVFNPKRIHHKCFVPYIVENNALGSALTAENKQKLGTIENYESGTQATIKEACSGGPLVSCETAMAA